MNRSHDKSLSRGFSTDMSPGAILHRLKIVDELYQLGKLLATAQYVGSVEDLKQEGDPEVEQEPPGPL